jgi:dienelactone hydrolase
MFPKSGGILTALVTCVALAGCATPPPETRETLRESVVMVKKPGLFPVRLETTIFRPPGTGPHPVVMINHGKSKGDPAYQRRSRYLVVVRQFLQRGYAVAIPMRQGFSNSTGYYKQTACNFARNGLGQAEDVRHVLDYLGEQSDLDTSRVVIMGQSHGGLTTLALGSLGLPSVVGLVNFAGGLRNNDCTSWGSQLAGYVATYAPTTTVPSLWFYGDNDSVFPTEVWKAMYAQYQKAGGNARLVAFGKFGRDAHAMFGGRKGLPIWLPEVTRFFDQLGLPFKKKHEIAFAKHDAPVPPTTSDKRISDYSAFPKLGNFTPERHKRYVDAANPKAFAVSPTGGWSWRTGVSNVMRSAIERCEKRARGKKCKLFAVDDAIVWVEQ